MTKQQTEKEEKMHFLLGRFLDDHNNNNNNNNNNDNNNNNNNKNPEHQSNIILGKVTIFHEIWMSY